MITPSPVAGRLDYLDAVRAFALLLGIVFHSSLSFTPIFIGWAVMDVSTSSIVSVFMLISHSFRMALFFLIAGFFSHKMFHGKGARYFLKSRWGRIAVPFFVAWLILRPLIVSGWIMGAESLRGDVNILNGLCGGFALLKMLPKGLFIGTHLWFLYYLLLVTTMVLILRFIISLHGSVLLSTTQWADVALGWLSSSRIGILVLSCFTALCLWFMDHWGVDTPDKTLVPKIPVLVVYGSFFLFGWLLNRQGQLIEPFSRLNWKRFTLCLVATIAAALLSEYSMKAGHPFYLVLQAAFCLSYAIMMWSFVVLTIGLFKRYFSRPNKAVRYFADASYWLYLCHLPIVVWLQIFFAELPFHWTVKLFAISAITIFVSLLIYDLCIRATFVGAILNGRRKSRLLFIRDKNSRCVS